MKKITYIFLIATLILNSCKKEIVEIPESNSPVFALSGTIGDDTLDFYIGDDISTFSTAIEKVNGIDFYSGTLKHEDTEIELGIYRGDNDFENLNIDSLLGLQSINLAQLASTSIFEIKKNQFPNYYKIKEIKWYVDGEYFGTNYIKITNPGKYNVCAEITYTSGESTDLCNEILVGFRRNTNFKLDYAIGTNNQLSSWIETSDGFIASVNWYMNDVLISTDYQITTTLANELAKIKAEITFTNGTKRTRSIIVDGTGSNKSIQDFGQYENLSGMAWDYKLKLVIRHLGNEYTSLFANNENNKLEITQVDFLGFNSNNKPVYIFKGILNATVNCKASNENLNVKLNVSWGLNIQ